MSTQGSREQDAIARKAVEDARAVERESNPAHQVGQEARAGGTVGGGAPGAKTEEVAKD